MKFCKFLTFGLSSLMLISLVGCGHEPINYETPNSIQQALPMSQVDTENNLASIGTNIVMKSGAVMALTTQFYSRPTEYNAEELESILSSIDIAIENTQSCLTQLKSFHPAQVLEERTEQIYETISKIKDDLTALKGAIEANDKDSVKAILNTYKSDIEVLKNISM